MIAMIHPAKKIPPGACTLKVFGSSSISAIYLY
jgi:hypothetical protein